MGSIRGIPLTKSLRSTIEAILVLAHPHVKHDDNNDNNNDNNDDNVNDQKLIGASSTFAKSHDSSSFSASATAIELSAAALSLSQAKETTRKLFEMSVNDAHAILEAALHQHNANQNRFDGTKSIHTNAMEQINEYKQEQWQIDNGKHCEISSDDNSSLPLAGIHALQTLLHAIAIRNTDDSTAQGSSYNQGKSHTPQWRLLQLQLESNLCGTKLCFDCDSTGIFSEQSHPTNNSSNSNESDMHEQNSFQRRLSHLRLLSEEKSYSKYTSNLCINQNRGDDAITTKSMLYATSVGLNMIVAPISFGVFIYFFIGGVIGRRGWWLINDSGSVGDDVIHTSNFNKNAEDHSSLAETAPFVSRSPLDSARVIIAVLAGVILLFIEMILFVIRSHEMDASIRKKKRRKENWANPFGYTKKNMERVYMGERE